ncbi:transporter [Novimethylophilus kurashikiensis]|uniref:Transporter n=1 Tax=Novimethylophilus kurashikiensis TaxID=1825523 RepID=A0A2R5F9K5_9PROT|nr:BON domain-containing protein [Novimethylophilus kurashikiensis]GBG13371.1 transporter [Novimethylophilus kurashikiensis]
MRLILALIAAAMLAGNLAGCVPVVAGGAAAGGLMAADRRTSGAYIDDQAIELKASKQLNDTLDTRVHADVTSYNRNVLLTGEAYDEPAKQKAESVVKGIENVRSVTNEMIIGPQSSMSSRSNDAYITSKVKARMVSENKFPANYVKVITENGVVYLMGMVTRQEADDAVEIARNTEGVDKVVKVFEYVVVE